MTYINNKNYYYWIYLIIIGIIFYILNCFTPLCSDDWHYCFVFGTTHPIESISDIVHSQYIHYFEMNGRLIPQSITQFFDGIAGKSYFNIFNTIVYIIFIDLINKIISHNSYSIVLATLTVLVTSVFYPYFGECYLWMNGSCNYLWASTLLLYFHYLLLHKYKSSILTNFILFFFGIICGWTQEGILLGASMGYFIYFIIHRKELTTTRIVLLFGLYLGVLMMVISPANINRATTVGALNVSSYFDYIRTIISFKGLRIFYLFVALFIIYYCYKKEQAKEYIKNHIFEITSLITLFLFILFIKSGAPRSHYGIEFFSALLAISILYQWKYKRTYLIIANTVIIIGSIPVLLTASHNYKEYKQLVYNIQSSQDGIIKTNEVKVNNWMKRYIIKPYTSEYDEFHYSFCPSYYENKNIANHFSKDSLVFLPEKFVNEAMYSSNKYANFNIPTDYPFYAKEIYQKNISKVVYELKETDYKSIPFYIKPFARKLDRYTLNTLEATKYCTITIGKKHFLLVGKHKLLDNRIINIQIE